MPQERMTSKAFRERYGSQARVRPPTPKTDYKAQFLRQLKLCGLPKPKTEFKFHPTRKWRYDFYWKPNLVADYQGGIYTKGKLGHATTKGLENDYEKHTEASLMGYTVLLITAKTVENGKALGFVSRALKGEK